MSGKRQHDDGQKIDEHRKTAKKPAGYLCNHQDTCSLAGIALVAISLRTADNKTGYQEKRRDGNTIDKNK
jgi:hypothetical protein